MKKAKEVFRQHLGHLTATGFQRTPIERAGSDRKSRANAKLPKTLPDNLQTSFHIPEVLQGSGSKVPPLPDAVAVRPGRSRVKRGQ